ncbi:adhesion G-protein coupled receptor G2, partial [Callorhinchus milii]|uniref:adhesion G-protein coupled receptor G2 n=1 Tax=Callorhinchus milii TaxID=7868 RepID=UPI001C3F7C48
KLNEILDKANVVTGLAGTLVGTVSNLLNASADVLASSSTRMVQSVDKIGLRLNFSADSVKLTSTSLALAVTKVNVMGFSGANFSISNITDLQVSLGEESPQINYAAIQLPNSLLTNLQTEEVDLASRIQFSFYEKNTVFQDASLSETSILNSYIIASSVANLSVQNLVNPVRVTLRNLQFNENNSDVQCVFWDFDKNSGQGGWSADGCTVAQKTVNQTTCECHHLTNFAVLLDLSRSGSDDQILTFITYIGSGISALFLSVTLVTYIFFEKLRRDYPSKILINLCTALLFLNMVFLIDSWISAYEVNGLCIAVAVFLHYFLLASFTWMSLEAFHMYLALVKVFNTYVRKYMLKFCIAGWGIPAVVVAIVLIIGPDNYGFGKYGKRTEDTWDVFCWIKNDIVFYVAVVAYFCLMFLVNISMFIVVMIQLCRIKQNKQHQHVQRNVFRDIKSVAGLTFLLGITWGFAFFAWGPVNQAFTYVFTIFNSLQGFFIFVFHCVAKETVRKQWRTYLCCGKYRLPENSEWSRTATNNTKKLQPIVHAMSLSSASNNSLHSSSTNSSMIQIREYSSHPNMYGNIDAETNKVSSKVSRRIALLHEPSSR